MNDQSMRFEAKAGFNVPDTTLLFPFLNSLDIFSGLDPDLLHDFSLSLGEIAPRSHSKVHLHPLVTHVTLVLSGRLEVRLYESAETGPVSLYLAENQAALARPGTFQQLINDSGFPCRVLYVVGPAYVFLADGERVLYDDAVVLDEEWEHLVASGWIVPSLPEPNAMKGDRDSAIRAIRKRWIDKTKS